MMTFPGFRLLEVTLLGLEFKVFGNVIVNLAAGLNRSEAVILLGSPILWVGRGLDCFKLRINHVYHILDSFAQRKKCAWSSSYTFLKVGSCSDE